MCAIEIKQVFFINLLSLKLFRIDKQEAMKNKWYGLVVAAIVLLFCQNRAQALSAENKALLKRAYYKTGQYMKYAVGGALVAEFGPSYVTSAAMVSMGKIIVDSIHSDIANTQASSHKVEEMLAEFVATTFAGAGLITGVAVFICVLANGGFKFPLWAAAGGITTRALLDIFNIADLNYIYDTAKQRITILLTEEQAETFVKHCVSYGNNQEDCKEL